MLSELKKEMNYTLTENGALAYASSLSHCLDFFATVGGLRSAQEKEIIDRFIRAYQENPDIAMKILFYTRDIRGGLGERRIFRTIIRYMASHNVISIIKNMEHIAEYGRYDDLLTLLDTRLNKHCVEVLKLQFEKDLQACEAGEGSVSLLAKWLPSVNTSNKAVVRQAKLLAKAFGMSESKYRKSLSMLRKKIDIIENYLRTMDYSFDYEKQASKAMFKYIKAFYRNDRERYESFLSNVADNKAKLNTSSLYPYELIRPFYGYNRQLSEGEKHALDITWKSLEDFTAGEDALVVVDGSGSMYGGYDSVMPATVAQSLGIYFAERNKGAFANHFITFSHRPRLIEIKGKTIADKLSFIQRYNEVANTDIEAVFRLILDVALKHQLPQDKLPKRLYIISDMEFDESTDGRGFTQFDNAKKSFEAAGYKLPELVFWNVDSRALSLPITKNDQGAIMVSGCSARIFEQITSGEFSPEVFMLKVVDSERYRKIVA